MEIKKVSKKGLDFIAHEEGGYYLSPYLDIVKVATISAGCTFYEDGTKVKITDHKITLERAKELFSNLIKQYELAVYSRTRDDINQNQFDALTSLCYNIGVSAFGKSTLLIKVNKNPNNPDIANEFAKWRMAGGQVIRGLQLRRTREAQYYFSK
jgi:lysozyme